MAEVVWKAIPGFDRYEVSSLGRVRVVKPDVTGRYRYIGHIVSQHLSKRGYYSLLIRNDAGEPKNVLAHQAVAAAFLGEKPPECQHNHKNGDKTDNRPENLEYVTASENYRHALDVLGHQPVESEEHWNAHLSNEDVRQIRQMVSGGELQRVAAEQFGCAPSTVSNIVNRRRRKHA